MRTVVLGNNPELEAIIARRQALGQDLYDEVWEGDYHVAPAASGAHALLQIRLPLVIHPFAEAAGLIGSGPFNLGRSGDYRVPDGGYHRVEPVGVWHATVAIAVEIVSPDDETYAKFEFYAVHGVEEVIVADPAEKRVRCFRLSGTSFVEAESSDLLVVHASYLTAEIAWP